MPCNSIDSIGEFPAVLSGSKLFYQGGVLHWSDRVISSSGVVVLSAERKTHSEQEEGDFFHCVFRGLGVRK